MAVPPHERPDVDGEHANTTDDHGLASVVGSNVRALMSVRRISQTKLAAALGYSQSGVSNRLSGAIPFNVTDLERIGRLFEIAVPELLRESPLLARRHRAA